MMIPFEYSKLLDEEQLAFINDFFHNCPESSEQTFIYKKYPQNHRLIHAGDTCSHVYILLRGRLQAIEERLSDTAYSFAELVSVEITGDFELFTQTASRLVTLTTLEPSACIVIPAADYITWMRRDANALFLRMQMLIRQITAQTTFERHNFFLDNTTRMMYFLYSEYRRQTDGGETAAIGYTRQQIADRLGCSVRTVNRIIADLQQQRLISLVRGKIRINSAQLSGLKAGIAEDFPGGSLPD